MLSNGGFVLSGVRGRYGGPEITIQPYTPEGENPLTTCVLRLNRIWKEYPCERP